MSPNHDIYSRAAKAKKHIGSFEVQKDNGFYSFLRQPFTEFDPTGWKFHLSIHEADIPRATQILADIYEKYGAYEFKVTDHRLSPHFSNPTSLQAGKIFTLYDRQEDNWPQIMRAVEREFRHAKIRHGPPVKGDRHVGGSHYAYYRNDGNFGSSIGLLLYMSAGEIFALPRRKQYNPHNIPDPYRDMNVVTGRANKVSFAIRVAAAARVEQLMQAKSEEVLSDFNSGLSGFFAAIVGRGRPREASIPKTSDKKAKAGAKPKL